MQAIFVALIAIFFLQVQQRSKITAFSREITPSTSFAVGLAVWMLTLMLFAATGLFRIIPIAVSSACILGLQIFLSRRTFCCKKRPGAIDLAAGLLLTVGFIVYVGHPKESILGERDEAIYTQHAFHLARTGGSAINLRELSISGSPQIEAISNGAQAPLPGIYPGTNNWTFQFSSAFPAIMAAVKLAAGERIALSLNAFFGLANAYLFFLLLKKALPRRLMVCLLPILACYIFNPAQIWISRNTLSEPLSAFFLLAGLASVSTESKAPPCNGLLAGALIGLASFVRIDGVLYPASISVLLLTARLINATPKRIDHLLTQMACGSAVISGLGIAYYFQLVPTYFRDMSPLVIAAGSIVMIAMSLSFLIGRIEKKATLPRFTRTFLSAASILLVGYAIFVRPHIEPYSLIHSELVPSLNGTRDYREIALQNLAAYLTWPVVCAAAIGLAIYAYRIPRFGINQNRTLVLGVFLTPCIIFLWNPMISPDHVWASRRWVSAVFPAVLLLTAFAIRFQSLRISAQMAPFLAWPTTFAMVLVLLIQQRDTLFKSEDGGTINQVRAIADFLPTDRPIYVTSWPAMASALMAGFGKPVIPITEASRGVHASMSLDPHRACTRKLPCLVIHPQWIRVNGPYTLTFATGTMVRLRRNKSPRAVPKGMHWESTQYMISQVADE